MLMVAAGGLRAAEQAPAFATRPKAVRDGEAVSITFAVSAPTDVEVAVLDAKGGVVRHLGAGMLGDTPPEPFRKGLSQAIVWDGRDDLGKPASGGPFRVRVALGLRPRLDRIIGWSGQNLDNPQGIACGPDGTLYAAFGHNLTAHAFTTVICAYDREGRYLRQVVPASPALPADQRKGWPRMRVEGIGEMPIVHHALSRSTYPAFSLDYRCFPAVSPDGSLLLLSNPNLKVKHADFGDARTLLKLGADGSVPEDYMCRKIAEKGCSC
jgi:hypothetical protein